MSGILEGESPSCDRTWHGTGKARRVYHAETVVAIACGSFFPLFFRVFRARCFRGLNP